MSSVRYMPSKRHLVSTGTSSLETFWYSLRAVVLISSKCVISIQLVSVMQRYHLPPYNNLNPMQILNKKSQPHPIPPSVPPHLTKFFQDNLGPAEGRWSVSDCLQFFLGLQCGSTKLSLPSHTLAPVKNVETTYSAVLKAMGPLCLRGRRVCVTGIVEIKNPELQRNFDRHHGLITQMLHGTDSYHTISSEGFVVQERKNSQGQYLRKHSDDPLLFGSGVYLTPVFYKAS
eukprot:PhF_6_TR5582/c1_g2_i2/m.7999